MTSQGFENISNKPELLIRIYELLTFSDQLRFSRVNEQLKSIFMNFIHPEKYRVLIIMKTMSGLFFVTNELKAIRLLLTPEALEEFVNVFAETVEELLEDVSHSVENIVVHLPKTETPNVRIEHFHNLTRLQYVSALIQEGHIKLIGKYCPNLKELYLINCYRNADREPLTIANDLSIKTLEHLKKLKSLVVYGLCIDENFEYSVFSECVTKLNLECLKLIDVLVPDQCRTLTETDSVQHHLKELQIATTFDSEIWANNFSTFLRNFENLTILTLRMPGHVTEEMLHIIAITCKNLEKFTIESYTRFHNIQQFSMPPKVTEFALQNCYGLTHENLKQILTQFRIQIFVSGNVVYMGEFEDFGISPFIHALDLPEVSTYKFPSAYVNNANMKKLEWYVNDDNEDEEVDADFMPCQVPGPLETCINLEILNINSGYMPLNPILKLNHLQKLKIPEAMPLLNWSYIIAVLKHSPLTELDIHGWLDSVVAKDLLNASDTPTQGFQTNVKIININFVVFERALDFWLDLFNHNPDMRLVCNYFIIDDDFLQKLIGRAGFPKDLRTIEIWGISIHCKDLKKNFKATMKMFYQFTDHFPSEHVMFERIERFVLSRKHF